MWWKWSQVRGGEGYPPLEVQGAGRQECRWGSAELARASWGAPDSASVSRAQSCLAGPEPSGVQTRGAWKGRSSKGKRCLGLSSAQSRPEVLEGERGRLLSSCLLQLRLLGGCLRSPCTAHSPHAGEERGLSVPGGACGAQCDLRAPGAFSSPALSRPTFEATSTRRRGSRAAQLRGCCPPGRELPPPGSAVRATVGRVSSSIRGVSTSAMSACPQQRRVCSRGWESGWLCFSKRGHIRWVWASASIGNKSWK